MPFTSTPRLPVVVPEGPSRLTHRRLRRPTRLPATAANGVWNRYLARLAWLFG